MDKKTWGDRLVPYPVERVVQYTKSGDWGDAPTAQRFHEMALRFPDRTAVVDQSGSLSYAELDRRTDLMAAGLGEIGIQVGDPVLFQLTNGLGCVLAWYAVLKCGAVPVATLASHRGHEIGYISRKVGATAHLVDTDLPKFDLAAFALDQAKGHPTLRHILAIGSRLTDGVTQLEGLGHKIDPAEARARVEAIQATLSPTDVAVFQLSGGTTGAPKVIPRLHAEYWNNALLYANRLGRTEEARVAHLAPLIHNAGILCGLHGAHSVGACLVLPPLETEAALSFMTHEQVDDVLFGPASFHWPELSSYQTLAQSLRTVVLSGTKVPLPVFTRVQELGARVGQLFGMSEGLCTTTDLAIPDEIRLAYVGSVLSSTDEVRVLDPSSEQDLAPGQVGELACRGAYTITGYFAAPEHNRTAFTSDGFYRTGDLARLDTIDGVQYLSIEGRIKDVINRGGEKINAEEVELLLLRHPGITQAAVVAMPDPRLGERTCAYVVPVDREIALSEVQHHFESLEVAKFKWPERIVNVDRLPQTHVGKIDKKTLRGWVSGTAPNEVSVGLSEPLGREA
ncbi:AMP-binding protein [Rhodococcus erythropolis]|uniref:(2,3-dihydroxybenzoyl)adenylate synthase n=1 Tax=Rhodococcus erythropolis TaxID=1833 RepID=UPI00139D65F3|nr:AMP-binding protein [Rhodococcus erythropolis]MQP33291.1 AMP-binding protein [Rhodococcus erythropolis]